MIRRSLAIVFAAAVAAGCGGSGPSAPSASAGTGPDAGATADAGTAASEIVAIKLSQTDVHIPRFTMTAFAVSGMHADGTTVDVTEQSQARSSNPEVVSVSSGPGAQIQIHALDEGSATITVTFGSLQQECRVTVLSN